MGCISPCISRMEENNPPLRICFLSGVFDFDTDPDFDFDFDGLSSCAVACQVNGIKILN